MQAARRFKLDKLIRDNWPADLRERGITVFDRVMEKDEYLKRLKEKLLEEVNEISAAQTTLELTEELADLTEVIAGLASFYHISERAIAKQRKLKKEAKGGFEKRLYISAIQIDNNNPDIEYYLRRPEAYPELEPV